jgi:outer membrane biosynthesis protein TonB
MTMQQRSKTNSFRFTITFSTVAHGFFFALLIALGFIPIHVTTLGIIGNHGPIPVVDGNDHHFGDTDFNIDINNPPPPRPIPIVATPIPASDIPEIILKPQPAPIPTLTPKATQALATVKPTATPVKSTSVPSPKATATVIAKATATVIAKATSTPNLSNMIPDIPGMTGRKDSTSLSNLIPGIGHGDPDGGFTGGGESFKSDINLPAEYVNKVCRTIGKYFILPDNLRNAPYTRCTVQFKIASDGTLSDIKVLSGQGTGKDRLDFYATNAIQQTMKLDPLPPLPGSPKSISASLIFEYSQVSRL